MKAFYADKIITEKSIEKEAYLLINEGKITGIKKNIDGNIPVSNYANHIIAPGYIDLHTHGALGYEPGYGDKKGLKKWASYKLKHGVTGFLPTTASIPLKNIKKAATQIKELAAQEKTNILGLHLEGPFYSRGKKIGVQNPKHVRSKFTDDFKELIEANSDIIRYISIDPLITDSEKIVAFCNKLNIKVAAGHSEISYLDFEKIKKGYSSITHTFNGMKGIHHRNPGLAYSACMDDNLYAEIICDGIHVINPVLKMFFRLKDHRKAVLITDTLSAAGMPSGSSYSIGDIQVKITDEGKAITNDGTLAGSTLTLEKAVVNVVHNLDISLANAIHMASLNPARLLGIDDHKGSLAKGKDADFIVLDNNLKVKETFIEGISVSD